MTTIGSTDPLFGTGGGIVLGSASTVAPHTTTTHTTTSTSTTSTNTGAHTHDATCSHSTTNTTGTHTGHTGHGALPDHPAHDITAADLKHHPKLHHVNPPVITPVIESGMDFGEKAQPGYNAKDHQHHTNSSTSTSTSSSTTHSGHSQTAGTHTHPHVDAAHGITANVLHDHGKLHHVTPPNTHAALASTLVSELGHPVSGAATTSAHHTTTSGSTHGTHGTTTHTTPATHGTHPAAGDAHGPAHGITTKDLKHPHLTHVAAPDTNANAMAAISQAMMQSGETQVLTGAPAGGVTQPHHK